MKLTMTKGRISKSDGDLTQAELAELADLLAESMGEDLPRLATLLSSRCATRGSALEFGSADSPTLTLDFSDCDPVSVELHLAIEKEMAEQKSKGRTISYFEAARLVELAEAS